MARNNFFQRCHFYMSIFIWVSFVLSHSNMPSSSIEKHYVCCMLFVSIFICFESETKTTKLIFLSNFLCCSFHSQKLVIFMSHSNCLFTVCLFHMTWHSVLHAMPMYNQLNCFKNQPAKKNPYACL